jgi:hypothetical protein
MPKLDWCELAVIFAGGFLGALAWVVLVQTMPTTPGSRIARAPGRRWPVAPVQLCPPL